MSLRDSHFNPKEYKMDPEQIKEFLATDEGRAILNEVNSGLVKKRDELLSKTVVLKQKLDAYEQLGVAPEELVEIVKTVKTPKEEKKTETPDANIFNAKIEHLNSELQKRESVVNNYKTKLLNTHVESTLVSEIAKADGITELLKPMLQSRIRSSIDDNGDISVTIVNPDGTPMFRDGKEATIKDLINDIKSNEMFAGAFKVKPASGSGTKGSFSGGAVSADPSSPNFNLTQIMAKQKR